MKDIQIEKGNFTTTYNDIFRAEIDGVKISPEAWGVYIFMLSLPEDWDYSIRGLVSVVNAGTRKIMRILDELEATGFLTREQQKENGKFSKIIYTIKRTPIIPEPVYSEIENITDADASPCCAFAYTENGTQQNTKEQKKIDKLKDKGLLEPQKYKKNNHILTNELIDKKVISILDYDIDKFNDLFIELDKRFDYKLVLKTTRYLIPIMKKQKNLDSKYGYFKTSIINNIKIEEAKRNRPPQKYTNILKEIESLISI